MGEKIKERRAEGRKSNTRSKFVIIRRKQAFKAGNKRIAENKRDIVGSHSFFRESPKEINSKQRFEFIHHHREKYTISEMCRILDVTRQGYDKYQKSLSKEDKHAELLAQIKAIIEEDEFNDKYGRRRLYESLKHRGIEVSESTVYRVCKKHNLLQKANKPKGLTKQEKAAYKSEDLLKGDFEAKEPGIKYVTDITQVKAEDGTVYISALFDCYDNVCAGLSMSDNMKTPLVIYSIESTFANTKPSKPPIVHSDRGSQYTSDDFRKTLEEFNITQSMSQVSLSCYGNAKCESMWGRLKDEAINGRYKTEEMTMEEVKGLVFRYFMGYWNHRRICSAIGGMPPMFKRERFLEQQQLESIA